MQLELIGIVGIVAMILLVIGIAVSVLVSLRLSGRIRGAFIFNFIAMAAFLAGLIVHMTGVVFGFDMGLALAVLFFGGALLYLIFIFKVKESIRRSGVE
jgi:hypothetical protein